MSHIEFRYIFFNSNRVVVSIMWYRIYTITDCWDRSVIGDTFARMRQLDRYNRFVSLSISENQCDNYCIGPMTSEEISGPDRYYLRQRVYTTYLSDYHQKNFFMVKHNRDVIARFLPSGTSFQDYVDNLSLRERISLGPHPHEKKYQQWLQHVVDKGLSYNNSFDEIAEIKENGISCYDCSAQEWYSSHTRGWYNPYVQHNHDELDKLYIPHERICLVKYFAPYMRSGALNSIQDGYAVKKFLVKYRLEIDVKNDISDDTAVCRYRSIIQPCLNNKNKSITVRIRVLWNKIVNAILDF